MKEEMKPEHDFQPVSFGHTATLERPSDETPEPPEDESQEKARRFTKAVVEAICRQKNLWTPHPNDAKALDGISQEDIDAYWTEVRTPKVARRTTLSLGEIAEIDRIVLKLITDSDPSLQNAVSLRISDTSNTYRRSRKNSQ